MGGLVSVMEEVKRCISGVGLMGSGVSESTLITVRGDCIYGLFFLLTIESCISL